MKVFISFTKQDHQLVHLLCTQLVERGLTPLVATQRQTPGVRLDEKVKSMIEESDCVVVLLTPQASRSHWVQQEIGCAKALRRYIVPLKTRGASLGAMLEGLEYYEFTRNKPGDDFSIITSFLRRYAEEHVIDVGLVATSDIAGTSERYLLHLPHAPTCPRCKSVDVHVFVCPLCGDWVCPKCGATIPPPSRAPGSAARAA